MIARLSCSHPDSLPEASVSHPDALHQVSCFHPDASRSTPLSSHHYPHPMTSHATAVEDLDLLDDETRHAYCAACYPDLQLGVPFIARCGRRAIGFAGFSDQPPPHACPDCLAVLDQPCEGGDPR